MVANAALHIISTWRTDAVSTEKETMPEILNISNGVLDLSLQETAPPAFLRVTKASVLLSRLLGNTTKGKNEKKAFYSITSSLLFSWFGIIHDTLFVRSFLFSG